MVKVSAITPSLSTPDRGSVEMRVEIPGIGAHWIECPAIRTAAGWQAQDSEKRDIGICADDLYQLGQALKAKIENPEGV